MKRLVLLILFVTFNLSPSQAKPLLIGTTTQNPPFSSIADQKNDFYGFDIDLMGAICNRIQQQCQFQPTVFNKLFTNLASRKIDLAIAAIIMTKDREQHFLFSLPYLESTALFMTRKESTINEPNDIINKKIGVRLGTPFRELAVSLYEKKITLVDFPVMSELLSGLNNDQVDAVLINSEAAKYWVLNNNSLYKLIGNPISIGGGYGIMANPDQTKLMFEINRALLNIEADGTYLNIYTRYFGDSK
jgi:arginine transport system substrate-binding protein